MDMRKAMTMIVEDARKSDGLTTREHLVNTFPEIGLQMICDAMRQLDSDGAASVQYGDNLPMLLQLRR